ncbi:MAG: hypothetical protein SOY42_10080 [Clostridium sp.]|nr:hypothetical protein [Clostridium sp.]
MNDIENKMVNLIDDFENNYEIYLEESIKREEMISYFKAMQLMISNHRKEVQAYLDGYWKQKDKLYEQANNILSMAINRKDVELAKLALEYIKLYHKENPFKDINKNLLF